MKFSKKEQKILVELFKASNGLFLFTLYRQLKLLPKDLFIAIESLKKNGLVDVLDDRATLTKEGNTYVISTSSINRSTTIKQELIKQEFLGRSLSINEFYIPQNFEK